MSVPVSRPSPLLNLGLAARRRVEELSAADGAPGNSAGEKAAAILAEHRPDAAGWCLGCARWWGRLVAYGRCDQVAWAWAYQGAEPSRSC